MSETESDPCVNSSNESVMRALIVGADFGLEAALNQWLPTAAFSVTFGDDKISGFRYARSGVYDLLLLQRDLRDGDDGIQLLKEIREDGITTPTIILSNRTDVYDRIDGLNAGADDYLVQPFMIPELIARMRAISRRARAQHTHIFRVADLELDAIRRRVERSNREIRLKNEEFDVLLFLMQNVGRAMSKKLIVERVWRRRSATARRLSLVDKTVARLREKINRRFTRKLIKMDRTGGYYIRIWNRGKLLRPSTNE